jgi:hypothetical protein
VTSYLYFSPGFVMDHIYMQSSSIRSFLLLTSFLLFTLAPYSTRLFPTVTIIRLLIGPASSIRLLIGRQLDHFQKSRQNHRTIAVCHFISDYNAVRRLPVFWTTTVPRHVLIVALGVHIGVVLTRTPLRNETRR